MDRLRSAPMPVHHPVRYVDHRVGEKPLQRTAAALAIVAGVAGVVLLVWFALGRPLHAVLLVVGAVAVLFFGFDALTSTGVHRVVAAVAAVIAGVGVIVGTVLKTIADAGVRNNTPVTLCGELAGRPISAMALIGLGFRSISMSPASIGPVKAMLLGLDLQALSTVMEEALNDKQPTASMREILVSFAESHNIPL